MSNSSGGIKKIKWEADPSTQEETKFNEEETSQDLIDLQYMHRAVDN